MNKPDAGKSNLAKFTLTKKMANYLIVAFILMASAPGSLTARQAAAFS